MDKPCQRFNIVNLAISLLSNVRWLVQFVVLLWASASHAAIVSSYELVGLQYFPGSDTISPVSQNTMLDGFATLDDLGILTIDVTFDFELDWTGTFLEPHIGTITTGVLEAQYVFSGVLAGSSFDVTNAHVLYSSCVDTVGGYCSFAFPFESMADLLVLTTPIVIDSTFSFDVTTPGFPIEEVGYSTFELAEVPIPAAAWLFGLAIVSLTVVGRRRSSES